MSGANPPPAESELVHGRAIPRFSTAPKQRRVSLPTVLAVVFAAVLIVLSTILVINHGALPAPLGPSGNPQLVAINGIHRDVTYRGNWSGYFGPVSNNSCDFCPIWVSVGGVVVLPVFTLDGPKNLTFWIFYNISGPFLMGASSCSGTGCTIPWVQKFSFSLYVGVPGLNQSIVEDFLMPNHSSSGPNIIQFDATICPSAVCAAPPTG